MIIIARYRAFMSDNYQGGSGKPYEDQVSFRVSNKFEMGALMSNVEVNILGKTTEVAQLTQCDRDSDYQLINIEVIPE